MVSIKKIFYNKKCAQKFIFGLTLATLLPLGAFSANVVQRPQTSDSVATANTAAAARPAVSRVSSVAIKSVQKEVATAEEEPVETTTDIIQTEEVPAETIAVPSVANKADKFESVFQNTSTTASSTLAEKIRQQRAILDAQDETTSTKQNDTTSATAMNACDTAIRSCMKKSCGNDFTNCALDSDTVWGGKVESCNDTDKCNASEFLAVANEIKLDRDTNAKLSNFENVMKCGKNYNSCIIKQCGSGFANCISSSGSAQAIASCKSIADECRESDSGLTARISQVIASARVQAEKDVVTWENRLYELRDEMKKQCEVMGAMFDSQSLGCVYTVEFWANADGEKTLFSSKNAQPGTSYDCTDSWFGVDISTYKENAFRRTASQTGASSAMLGAGVGTAAGLVSSGAIGRAIETKTAENALKDAQNNLQKPETKSEQTSKETEDVKDNEMEVKKPEGEKEQDKKVVLEGDKLQTSEQSPQSESNEQKTDRVPLKNKIKDEFAKIKQKVAERKAGKQAEKVQESKENNNAQNGDEKSITEYKELDVKQENTNYLWTPLSMSKTTSNQSSAVVLKPEEANNSKSNNTLDFGGDYFENAANELDFGSVGSLPTTEQKVGGSITTDDFRQGNETRDFGDIKIPSPKLPNRSNAAVAQLSNTGSDAYIPYNNGSYGAAAGQGMEIINTDVFAALPPKVITGFDGEKLKEKLKEQAISGSASVSESAQPVAEIPESTEPIKSAIGERTDMDLHTAGHMGGSVSSDLTGKNLSADVGKSNAPVQAEQKSEPVQMEQIITSPLSAQTNIGRPDIQLAVPSAVEEKSANSGNQMEQIITSPLSAKSAIEKPNVQLDNMADKPAQTSASDMPLVTSATAVTSNDTQSMDTSKTRKAAQASVSNADSYIADIGSYRSKESSDKYCGALYFLTATEQGYANKMTDAELKKFVSQIADVTCPEKTGLTIDSSVSGMTGYRCICDNSSVSSATTVPVTSTSTASTTKCVEAIHYLSATDSKKYMSSNAEERKSIINTNADTICPDRVGTELDYDTETRLMGYRCLCKGGAKGAFVATKSSAPTIASSVASSSSAAQSTQTAPVTTSKISSSSKYCSSQINFLVGQDYDSFMKKSKTEQQQILDNDAEITCSKHTGTELYTGVEGVIGYRCLCESAAASAPVRQVQSRQSVAETSVSQSQSDWDKRQSEIKNQLENGEKYVRTTSAGSVTVQYIGGQVYENGVSTSKDLKQYNRGFCIDVKKQEYPKEWQIGKLVTPLSKSQKRQDYLKLSDQITLNMYKVADNASRPFVSFEDCGYSDADMQKLDDMARAIAAESGIRY